MNGTVCSCVVGRHPGYSRRELFLSRRTRSKECNDYSVTATAGEVCTLTNVHLKGRERKARLLHRDLTSRVVGRKGSIAVMTGALKRLDPGASLKCVSSGVSRLETYTLDVRSCPMARGLCDRRWAISPQEVMHKLPELS